MPSKVECIVIICLIAVLYHNWTDFPKEQQLVRGQLIRLEVK